ncbi:MAG TPA: hypothetical protein VM864_09555 [Pyrinomonadaceae bacterium]|nr:hypothetical protein [Pyrinomonadaceae bacterium]
MGTRSKTFALACASLAVALAATALCALAQSSLLEAPTPVTSAEIAGRIPALDVGDARLTRHFYTLSARPGDLELTVTASNLEGDIDLFSAAALRPLTKVTLYGSSDTTVARTVFFRREETLILRVQARSPNDADGTYRIRFGGTFLASTAPAPDEPAPAAESSSSSPAPATGARQNRRGSYRVNSIGARIEEPHAEVAAAPSPTPEETDAEGAAAPPKPTPTRTNTARGRAAARRESARREGTRRAQTPAPAADAERDEAAKTEPAEPAAASGEAARGASTRAGTNRRRSSRAARAGASERSDAPPDAPPPAEASATDAAESAAGGAAALGLEAPGSRLILELRDGTRLVRVMSEVRRVAVEGRLVVIVLRSGRTERQPLSNVLRMTIEP